MGRYPDGSEAEITALVLQARVTVFVNLVAEVTDDDYAGQYPAMVRALLSRDSVAADYPDAPSNVVFVHFQIPYVPVMVKGGGDDDDDDDDDVDAAANDDDDDDDDGDDGAKVVVVVMVIVTAVVNMIESVAFIAHFQGVEPESLAPPPVRDLQRFADWFIRCWCGRG